MLGRELSGKVPIYIGSVTTLRRVHPCVAIGDQEMIAIVKQGESQSINFIFQGLNFCGSLKFASLKLRIDLIYSSVNKVKSHAHVIVNIQDLLLVNLDLRELIFCRLLVIYLESEQFRLDWDLRQLQVKLIVRQKLIFLLILKELDSRHIVT
jgi:hypothetical protein